MIHIDLHCHTQYSIDSLMPTEVLIDRCVQRGISCLAVTEHNNIDGALAAQKIAPFKIIVGEEVRTSEGEIIGLFLNQGIPRGLSPEETIARIRAQGGLVAVPHPCDRFRNGRLTEAALRRIAGEVDIMEAFNARTTLLRDSDRAEAIGRRYGHILGIGSDSHTSFEVGGAYIEMEDFDLRDHAEFLEKLRHGRLVGQRANPLVHLPTRAAKLLRALKR